MPALPNVCNNSVLRKAGRNLGVLYDDVIAPSGLRGGQFSILSHVAALDRPTMKALAEELVMDLSALGHTLKPLVRDGYLALEPNPEDRRSKRVALTPAGKAKLTETIALWRRAQRRFETVFGAADSKRLRDMLSVVASDDFADAFRGADLPRRRSEPRSGT